MENNNGWDVWSKHVLIELEDLNKRITTMQDDLTIIKINFAKLEERLASRSTIFGAVGAMIPIMIMLLIEFLRHKT